jgi:hypothetical protein
MEERITVPYPSDLKDFGKTGECGYNTVAPESLVSFGSVIAATSEDVMARLNSGRARA